MDNDNQLPLLFLAGLVWLSSCLRDALGRHQASRHNLSGISNPLAGGNGDGSPDANGYCDGEHWKHGVLLSEDTISDPAGNHLPQLIDLLPELTPSFQGCLLLKLSQLELKTECAINIFLIG